MKTISPLDLIPMSIFAGREPMAIDLVYASANHPRNIFGEALYHNQAQLWAHKDIAAITLLAARILNQKTGYILSIKDCLRTSDAQVAMRDTKIVRDNPDWLEEPNRMVSPPGSGAHPRGMAIDVCVLDSQGREVDMGTPFDDMDEKSYRSCDTLPEKVLENRRLLEEAFNQSAKTLGFELLPLPSEWWDFRFPPHISDQYLPLSDRDLPPQMQMTNKIDTGTPDFEDAHFEKLAETILARIS